MSRRSRIRRLPSSSDSSSDEENRSPGSQSGNYSQVRPTQTRIPRPSNCMFKDDVEARQQAKLDQYDDESDDNFINDGSDIDEESECSDGEVEDPVKSRSNSDASSISITSSEDEVQEMTAPAMRNMVQETDSENEEDNSTAPITECPSGQSFSSARTLPHTAHEELLNSTSNSNQLSASQSTHEKECVVSSGHERTIPPNAEHSQENTIQIVEIGSLMVKHEETTPSSSSRAPAAVKTRITPNVFSASKDGTTPTISSANKDKTTPSAGCRRKSSQRRVLDSDDEDVQVIQDSENENSDVACVYDEKTTPSGRKRRKKNYNRIKILPDSQEAEDNNGEKPTEEEDNSDCSSSDDEMSDFIVDDSQSISGREDEEIFYPEQKLHRYTGNLDKEQAFLLVLDCFLNQCVDPDFFTSRDFTEPNIRSAFRKIFTKVDMLIQDLRSTVWCSHFVSLLDCPEICSYKSDMAGLITCEACNRAERYVSHKMRFSGVKYNKETLQDIEVSDEDEDSDNTCRKPISEGVHVGKYCMIRARAYHELLHFKKQLFDSCLLKIRKLHLVDAQIETICEKVLADKGWIKIQLMHLNTVSDQATKIIQKRSGITEDDFIN